MIGAFLFVALLTNVLQLSFFGFATISEAVQIFIIGLVILVLIFRLFKELKVGPITSKPGQGIHQILNIGGKSAWMDSFSGTDSNSRGERLANHD
jgi:hypothetical protein